MNSPIWPVVVTDQQRGVLRDDHLRRGELVGRLAGELPRADETRLVLGGGRAGRERAATSAIESMRFMRLMIRLSQSPRSTDIGSTRAARSAGSRQAASRHDGEQPVISGTSHERIGRAHRAPGRPRSSGSAAAPSDQAARRARARSSHAPCRSTVAATRRPSAPSAMRTANSRVARCRDERHHAVRAGQRQDDRYAGECGDERQRNIRNSDSESDTTCSIVFTSNTASQRVDLAHDGADAIDDRFRMAIWC